MYFFDTYAMIEIVKGNTNYERYVQEPAYATIFQLYEFYYSILAEFGENAAKEKIEKLNAVKIEVSEIDIAQASKFKLKNKAKKLSYADALGYEIAKSRKLKFLTGDRQFAGMENVEFVK